jgi:hypothetical protein
MIAIEMPAQRAGAPSLRRSHSGFPLRFVLPVLTVAAIACAPAAAQDYPKLKPGLWEMERSGAGGAPQLNRMSMCLDATVQKQMFDMGAGTMQGMCSKHEFKISGNRGSGDFVCDFGGSKMHSTSTMTMTGDSAYRTEIYTTYDPPFMGQKESTTVLTARHVGACKPGQRPGDMVLPNGQTMNVRDAIDAAKGAGASKGRPPASGTKPKVDRQPG